MCVAAVLAGCTQRTGDVATVAVRPGTEAPPSLASPTSGAPASTTAVPTVVTPVATSAPSTTVATISDTVDLARFGLAGGPTVQGSPVEAAFSPDSRHAFVSNYKMYGPGYHPVADDDGNRGQWDQSFVYRIDVATFAIDAVIPVGAVPKYLAVSPDGRTLVVSNWCSFDVSPIDLATLSERARIDVGRHPRGIAITSDSRLAYVTVMGEARIVAIELSTLAAVDLPNAGATPATSCCRQTTVTSTSRTTSAAPFARSISRREDLRDRRRPDASLAAWSWPTTVRACTSSTTSTAP
jgi:YVTN family beta-propeller protein